MMTQIHAQPSCPSSLVRTDQSGSSSSSSGVGAGAVGVAESEKGGIAGKKRPVEKTTALDRKKKDKKKALKRL